MSGAKVTVTAWTVQRIGAEAWLDLYSARVPFEQFHRDTFWAERELGAELKALRRAGARVLRVTLNATGGAISYCNGIARAIADWKGPKRLLIAGQCASAATLILCVPEWDDTAITPGSTVMIHRPRVEIYARKDGLWGWIGERQRASAERTMAKMYANWTGADRETVAGWMDGKTFSTQQAVAVHLCGRAITRWQWEKEDTKP